MCECGWCAVGVGRLVEAFDFVLADVNRQPVLAGLTLTAHTHATGPHNTHTHTHIPPSLSPRPSVCLSGVCGLSVCVCVLAYTSRPVMESMSWMSLDCMAVASISSWIDTVFFSHLANTPSSV